jgi:hypothetical protein
MLLDELNVGPFRIDAAAHALRQRLQHGDALRRRDQTGMREAWRDLDLGAGQRWARSEDALWNTAASR